MEHGNTGAMKTEISKIMERLSAQELSMLYSLAREMDLRKTKKAPRT